jgi:hypothetical protein
MPREGTIGEQVLAAVDAELVAHGLARRSRQGRYTRPRPHGADIYYLIVNRYTGLIVVAPDVAVRHEVAERIFHRTSGFRPAQQRTTPTIGGRLAELTRDPSYEVEIGPDDAPQELRRAERNLRASVDEAERYWARYADLREVDHALNDHPEQDTPHRPMPWLRCSTGLIVARLVQRPDDDELARVYLRQMRAFSDGFYLPRFQALVDYLAERTTEQLLAENQGPGPGRGRR